MLDEFVHHEEAAGYLSLCLGALTIGHRRMTDATPKQGAEGSQTLKADFKADVSHAEFVPRWLQPAGQPLLRTAYVEAVATAPSRRGRGLASAVMQRLGDEVAADPAWQLAALSPSHADFYARLGWESWRGPLGIRRADGVVEASPANEQVMIRRLPRTPATLDIAAPLTAEWREGELW